MIYDWFKILSIPFVQTNWSIAVLSLSFIPSDLFQPLAASFNHTFSPWHFPIARLYTWVLLQSNIIIYSGMGI